MAEDLKSYLTANSARGFRPIPHYFPTGDYLTYYFRNDPCFADRVDDLLTLYLTFDTRELVGCKIEGVKQILRAAGDFGVAPHGDQVRLGIFFFVGAALASDEGRRHRYLQIGRQAMEAIVDRKELEAV